MKNDKYWYSKYFIIFNQLLFFHLYIGRKTQYLLEYIETEGNIENEKKKLTNMVSRILLNPNIKESIILEKLLKDGQFENINQIRINPFLLETNKPSRKVNFLGKLLLKGYFWEYWTREFKCSFIEESILKYIFKKKRTHLLKNKTITITKYK